MQGDFGHNDDDSEDGIQGVNFLDGVAEEQLLSGTDDNYLEAIQHCHYPTDTTMNVGGIQGLNGLATDPIVPGYGLPKAKPPIPPTRGKIVLPITVLNKPSKLQAKANLYRQTLMIHQHPTLCSGIAANCASWGHPCIQFDSKANMALLNWRGAPSPQVMIKLGDPCFCVYLHCRLFVFLC